jgi:hypothetical protein
MTNLEDYLKKRENVFENLRKEIALLRSAKMPIQVKEYDSEEIGLFSQDYTLATDFKILKRSEHLGGYHCYDGGYSTQRYESYPQFYFTLKFKDLAEQVYIQHEGFDKDERIVIKSVTKTDGCKDYSDMTRREEKDIDYDKVLAFFRNKGVKEGLLVKLARRIKEAGEI